MSDISDIVLRIRVDIVNNAALQTLTKNVQNATKATQQSAKAAGVAGTAQTGLMQRIQRLANAQGTAQKQAGLLTQATTKIGKAMARITDPLSKVERKLDAVFRAGVHMQAVGRDLLGFARKMVNIGAGAAEAWGDFEFTLRRAASAADLFDSAAPLFKGLKQAIYGAAYEMRVFPAEEVAKGVYFWQSTTGEAIKTQEDLEQTMKNVTSVMKLAAMTDTGYETAIKGVYSTLKQFNMTTKETTNVSELLFYATQKTALEFPDLIHAFKMTGAVMGQAKEPLDTMVAVLGAIGNAGFRGSQAGRALRQTYIKVVKPTAAAKEELDKLFKAQGGYNKVAFNSKGNFIGMEKYMMKLARATKGMTYQQKAHLLATITTANELPVMTQMLGMAERAVKAGAKSWTEFEVTQQKAHEAFEGTWSNFAVSWRGVTGALKQSVEPTFLEVGRIIAETLTPTFLELSDALYKAGPAMQEIAKQIADTFQPVILWIGKTVKGFITFAQNNKKLVSTFAKWGVIATVIAAVAGAIFLFLGTMVLLVSSLATVLFGALPLIAVFVAIGVALAALALGVYKNVGGIKEAFARFAQALFRVFKLFIGGSEDAGQSVANLKDWFQKLSDSLTGKLADILNSIAGALEKLTPEQVDIIKKLVKALIGLKLLNTGLGIVSGTINGLAGNIIALGRAMGGAYPHIVNFIKILSPQNIKNIGSTLVMLGGSLLAFGRTVGAAIYAALGPIGLAIAAIVAVIAAFVIAYETNFLGFRDFVDGIVAWFIANVVPVIQQAIEFLGPIVETVVNAVATAIAAIVTAIEGIITFFSDLPGNIQKFIDEVITNIGNFVNSVITTIVTFLTDLVNNFGYYLGYALGVIIAFPIKVIMLIVEFGVNFIKTVVDFLSKLVPNFLKFLGDVWNTLSTWFINTIIDVAKWAGNMVGSIVDFFVKLPGRILEFLGNLWSTISTWFIDTLPKIAKAAGDLVQAVIDFFIALPGNIVNALKDLPTTLATVFTNLVNEAGKFFKSVVQVGKDIVEGIWKGIQNMAGWFKDQIFGFFEGIVDGVKDTLGIQSPSKVFAEIGSNITQGVAKGITSTNAAADAMTSMLNDVKAKAAAAELAKMGYETGGTFSTRMSSESTRKIELKVDVTSSDGSVAQVDVNTLAGLITGSDMVRALERMATVD